VSGSVSQADVEQLVLEAVEGLFTAEKLAEVGGSLTALDVSSLYFMKILDAVERRFRVVIEPTVDPSRFETVRGIHEFILEQQLV